MVQKPHFPQLETQKIHFLKKTMFRKSLLVPKKELPARKTTFSQAGIRYKSGRVLRNPLTE